MTSISKNVYIDKLVDIVSEFNIQYHKLNFHEKVLQKTNQR